MRKRPILGEAKSGVVPLDINRLILTRMVLQANSGAGKSWAIRRLLEQTYGHVIHIVIDVEDEFYTLREKFDYVLARAEGGDCPATIKTAKLLARRIMELEVSTIVGISELKAHERYTFVRTFIEALMSLPKNLRKHALVVVDEAHLFAPEKAKAESTAAIVDLMTRGRKRGLCGILATQRISKLNKDALAEANNKLIGRAAMDLDKKRSGDELGFHARDYDQLRTLKPGEFFAYGPALSDQVVKVQIGSVQTTHPEPGKVAPPVPVPGKKLQKALQELQELPQEANKEIVDLQGAKKEIAVLRRALSTSKKPGTGSGATKEDLKAEYERGWAESEEQTAPELENLRVVVERQAVIYDEILLPNLRGMKETAQAFDRRMIETAKVVKNLAQDALKKRRSRSRPPKEARIAGGFRRKETSKKVLKQEHEVSMNGLSAAQKKILNGLAWWMAVGIEEPSRRQLAFASGYTVSGHFNNTLGGLRTSGMVDYPNRNQVCLTHEGAKVAIAPSTPPTEEELQNLVREKLNVAQVKIYDVAVQVWPDEIERDELAEESGYTVSGHFNNTLGSLRTLGVIDYPRRGVVKASDILFMESLS